MFGRRDIDLVSPHSPEDIARTLKKIMKREMPKKKARVIGNGTQYDMELRYVRRRQKNSFAPVLKAKMEPHDGGTRITGTLGIPIGGISFLIFWFAMLAMIFIPAGFTFDITLLLISAGMALFGAIFGWVGIRAGREDPTHILGFLARELDAHPADT